MTRKKIEAFFERRQQAWNRLDAAALAADHTEEGVVESPTAGRHVGREKIESVYGTWFAAFPDLVFKSEDLVIDGERVALFFTGTGTHKGPFFGLSATNKRIEVRGVFFYKLNGDKIAYERRIYDFTGLLIQIGILKAKPA